MFPGDHTGFAEDPARFATRLCTVLRAKYVAEGAVPGPWPVTCC